MSTTATTEHSTASIAENTTASTEVAEQRLRELREQHARASTSALASSTSDIVQPMSTCVPTEFLSTNAAAAALFVADREIESDLDTEHALSCVVGRLIAAGHLRDGDDKPVDASLFSCAACARVPVELFVDRGGHIDHMDLKCCSCCSTLMCAQCIQVVTAEQAQKGHDRRKWPELQTGSPPRPVGTCITCRQCANWSTELPCTSMQAFFMQLMCPFCCETHNKMTLSSLARHFGTCSVLQCDMMCGAHKGSCLFTSDWVHMKGHWQTCAVYANTRVYRVREMLRTAASNMSKRCGTYEKWLGLMDQNARTLDAANSTLSCKIRSLESKLREANKTIKELQAGPRLSSEPKKPASRSKRKAPASSSAATTPDASASTTTTTTDAPSSAQPPASRARVDESVTGAEHAPGSPAYTPGSPAYTPTSPLYLDADDDFHPDDADS